MADTATPRPPCRALSARGLIPCWRRSARSWCCTHIAEKVLGAAQVLLSARRPGGGALSGARCRAAAPQACTGRGDPAPSGVGVPGWVALQGGELAEAVRGLRHRQLGLEGLGMALDQRDAPDGRRAARVDQARPGSRQSASLARAIAQHHCVPGRNTRCSSRPRRAASSRPSPASMGSWRSARCCRDTPGAHRRHGHRRDDHQDRQPDGQLQRRHAARWPRRAAHHDPQHWAIGPRSLITPVTRVSDGHWHRPRAS